MVNSNLHRLSARRRHAAVAVTVGAAVVLAGCAGGESADDTSAGADKTLKIWYMNGGSWTENAVPDLNAQFESETGATVEVEVQQWDGIVTKLTTALASDNPPDIIEIGNTNVGLFAANGALVDLTDDRSDLEQGETWLETLSGPATIDGQLYAVPLKSGTRAVVYNTEVWAEAGITEAPTTYDDLIVALDKIEAAHPEEDYAPLYIPGGNWYAGLQFVGDAGGGLAKQGADGTWTATINSPESVQGLEDFKSFQNQYSTIGSRTAGTNDPNPNSILEAGKASAIVTANNAIATIVAQTPELEGKLDSFALPSKYSADTMPAWVGGTELAISVKSQNIELAKEYLKLIASPEVQEEYVVGVASNMPISTGLIDAVAPSVPESDQGFYTAAKNGIVVPSSPNWPTIEGDNSIAELFLQVASGQRSVDEAADDFADHLESVLNAE